MAPPPHRSGFAIVLLLGLAACHDAPRTNPFDPALTPPVELQVALDDTAGTATLTWTRYEGQQSFREYRVLRKVPGLEKVDTLAYIAAVDQRTFVDSSLMPATDYLYRVSVVNSGGLEVPSPEEEARPLSLPVVQLREVQLDSRTATAALRWTAYRGPRFKAYRVERRSVGLAPLMVKEISALADTAYVDSLLSGNTEYFYRVVVVTERGEELSSAEVSGKFHALLATWPLELEEPGYVRLYGEEDRLTALVTDPRGVRLRFYDPEGTLRQEQVLLGPQRDVLPRSVATALSPEGKRFVFVLNRINDQAITYSQFGVVQFDTEGKPLPLERHVHTDDLPTLSEELWPLPGPLKLGASSGGFDYVAVFRGDSLLFADDFSSGGKQWTTVDPAAVFAAGQVTRADGAGSLWLVTTGNFSSQNLRIEADGVMPEHGRTGGITFRVGGIGMTLVNGVISWEPRAEGTPAEAFPDIYGLSIHLSLEVVDRRISVSVTSPVFWPGVPYKGENLGAEYLHLGWGSLVLVDGVLGLTAGDQPYSISQEGKGVSTPVFAEEVSETRTWKAGGEAQRLGICLPRINQILVRKGTFIRNTGAIAWPNNTDLVAVGTGVGQGAGELLYPLSFDAGPDGRIFVLDAGNGRIQVFDTEGQYLTQWGHKGSGEGEFDFGSGQLPEDFAGSVAVDSEGFIYVADVGNKRIQKFAP